MVEGAGVDRPALEREGHEATPSAINPKPLTLSTLSWFGVQAPNHDSVYRVEAPNHKSVYKDYGLR